MLSVPDCLCRLMTEISGEKVTMLSTKYLKDLITEEKVKEAFDKLTSSGSYTVEGGRYILIHEDRYEDTCEFLRDHMFPDEPVCRSIGLTWDDEIKDIMMNVIKYNMSLAVVSETTGDIMGIRLTKIAKRGEEPDLEDIKSKEIRTLFTMSKKLDSLCNIFDHFGVDEVVQFFGLSVHRKYRHRGIARKLMEAAIQLIRNMDLQGVVIKGDGSSNYSKRIYEKLGFEMLSELVYADYKENDVVVCNNTGEHKSMRAYGKIL